MMSPNEVHPDWNRIEDKTLFTTHHGIATYGFSFYSAMIQKTVGSLIDTGIMKHLVDTRVLNLKKLPKNQNHSTFLNAKDFLVCFAFLFALYGFCGVVLAVEKFLNSKVFRKILKFLFVRKSSTFSKFKFAKVHQDEKNKSLKELEDQQLSASLLEKFKIRNQTQNNSTEFGENSSQISNRTETSITTITADVHHSADFGNDLQVFEEEIYENQDESEEIRIQEFQNVVNFLHQGKEKQNFIAKMDVYFN